MPKNYTAKKAIGTGVIVGIIGAVSSAILRKSKKATYSFDSLEEVFGEEK